MPTTQPTTLTLRLQWHREGPTPSLLRRLEAQHVADEPFVAAPGWADDPAPEPSRWRVVSIETSSPDEWGMLSAVVELRAEP